MYSVSDTLAGGLPHSEIHGSKLAHSSPRLIAAYHVLHRLSAPRHPPDTLKTLDCSHRKSVRICASFDRQIVRQHTSWLEKTSFASNASGDLSGQAPNPRLVARETR